VPIDARSFAINASSRLAWSASTTNSGIQYPPSGCSTPMINASAISGSASTAE
jgi:hypothetical protein